MDEKAFWGSNGQKRGAPKRARAPKPVSVTVSRPISAPVSRPKKPVKAKTITAGARLAACRQVVDHVCRECEEPFSGILTARYCSNRCRQRCKRRRKTRND